MVPGFDSFKLISFCLHIFTDCGNFGLTLTSDYFGLTLTSDYSKYRDKETPSLPVGFIITEGVTLEQCLITPWYEYHTYTILIQVGAI